MAMIKGIHGFKLLFFRVMVAKWSTGRIWIALSIFEEIPDSLSALSGKSRLKYLDFSQITRLNYYLYPKPESF